MPAPENSTRIRWLLLKLARKLWLRSAAFSVLAVLTALVAVLVGPHVPENLPARIGSESVSTLLDILASSMLAVTIFSLSTLVYAHAWASSNATPRAARLMSESQTAQNALATFLGVFLFSLVGIIALDADLYGAGGRVVQYAVTLVVIVVIVVTLLRWIDHVSSLGRVDETTQKVEERAARAIRQHHKEPYLGGQPFDDPQALPGDVVALYGCDIGYVQNIDMPALHELTCNGATRIFIAVLPGGFTDASRPLAWLHGQPTAEAIEGIREAFSIEDRRTFEQDPRFGLVVLTEIAGRALSPSMNDPGTAIDVLGRVSRLLAIWAGPEPAGAGKIRYPAIHVPPVKVDDAFDDVFSPVARDAAASFQVGIRLQKVLRALGKAGDARFRSIAQRHSALALARAEAALEFEDDLRRVRAAAAEVAQM